LICPNCGRRNPAGATFCSRCRQRLPLATKYSGQGYKRAVIAEPTGGGGGGALVLGVALLAGFLFIGGGAAIYLSTPPQPAPTIPAFVADASGGSLLPVFVQDTPTPIITAAPTPTPFFFSPDPGSQSPGLFSAPPTFGLPTPTPTPVLGPTPTPTPGNPTPTPTATPQPTPTPVPVVRSISESQDPSSLKVTFTAKVSGPVTQYQWDFGDGNGKTGNKATVTHIYGSAGQQTVTLIVSGPGGTSAPRSKTFTVDVPATPPPPTPTAPPTPGPS